MKNLYILVLALLSLGGVSFTQGLGVNASYFDDSIHARIDVNGFGSFGSSVMDIETMKLFYNGGFYDEELKAESIKRLGGKNLFGGEYGFNMTYTSPSASFLEKGGFYLAYEMSGGAGIDFSQDVFRFIFEGNQQFSNDSAFFSGTQFSTYNYKKIGIGYNENNNLKYGLSLMSFNNYTSGMINRGVYFGGEDTLKLRLDSDISMDDRSNHGSPVGYGLGADFEITLPLNPEDDTLDLPKLVLGFKNVGVFMSTKSMNNYRIDTIYNYSGVEANDLSLFQGGLPTREEVKDSILPENKQERIFKLLPFEFYFYSTSNPNGKKMQLVYGMRYRYGVAMVPLIYLGGDWRPNPSTIITPYLNFGGYSFVKMGVSLKRRFDKFYIGMACNNLPGYFSKEAYSRSISLNLSYDIR